MILKFFKNFIRASNLLTLETLINNKLFAPLLKIDV